MQFGVKRKELIGGKDVSGCRPTYNPYKSKRNPYNGRIKARMKGIYSTCISTGTLDEAPMAYKNADEIIQTISPTAEIIDHLKPLYNFKAG